MPAAAFENPPSLPSDSVPFDGSPTTLNGSSPGSPSDDVDESKSGPAGASSASAVCSCQQPRWPRPQDWTYRGEGNASVVLALPGREIVRLAKIDHRLRRMDSDAQFSDAAGARAGVRTIGETLERLVFSQKIFGPLLGAGLVRACKVFHIDQQVLDELAEELDHQRPAHRKHKRLAPVCHVIVCDDCTMLPIRKTDTPASLMSGPPTFCVEIKPKQGFLTASGQHCPFCLNQFLKKKHGKIQVLSQYCPLDLFSGQHFRMILAICALTRTPQNNLRIFQDGELVFADECQKNLSKVLQSWFQLDSDHPVPLLRHFSALVAEALTADLPEYPAPQTRPQRAVQKECPVLMGFLEALDLPDLVEINPPPVFKPKRRPINEDDDFCNMFAGKCRFSPCENYGIGLPEDCVLARLLRAQLFGDVNYDKLYEAYDALADKMRSEEFSYERLRWTNARMAPSWLGDNLRQIRDESEPQVHMVQRYRISATARDCSIMITFQRLSQGETYPLVLKDLSGREYKCNISVVDVDPKPVSCVDKHRRRDLAMNEAFREARDAPRDLNALYSEFD